ncbi:NAD(P)H-binding protein [Komagataeibacter rhaeticus]|nr:NAD(P)H-binding protein [Komagataeibacter rhaeticus]
MQTILGANGQIATELARILHQHHTGALRLVSRNPRKVNEDDTLIAANLLDAGQTTQAVKGSRIVYFTAGLPLTANSGKNSFPLCSAMPCRPAGWRGQLCLFRQYLHVSAEQPDPDGGNALCPGWP